MAMLRRLLFLVALVVPLVVLVVACHSQRREGTPGCGRDRFVGGDG